ncbi:DUF308 domain-containing protein [Candidatus Saccharibacteria bacterium]|nr:DUF308 domain-containing protein [Candidatus Saccharibacteria bacterium]
MVKAVKKKKTRSSSAFDNISKKVKAGLNAATISSLALMLLGVLFIVFPVSFLSILRWIFAVLFFLGGAALFASQIRGRAFFGTSVIAAILVVVGLIFATNKESAGIFSIILGAWFVVSALSSSALTSALSGAVAFCSRLLSFISLVCGILMIINPFGGSVSIMVFLGIVTIIHALSSLIDVLIMRSHLNDLETKISSVVIDGEEI